MKAVEYAGQGFANQCGYSDVEPFEVIRAVSGKTVEVRKMDAKLDPNWKMDFRAGGFCGHVANNREQTYEYSSNESNPVIRIRLSKKRGWRDANGNRFNLSEKPYKFYDYNF